MDTKYYTRMFELEVSILDILDIISIISTNGTSRQTSTKCPIAMSKKSKDGLRDPALWIATYKMGSRNLSFNFF